MVSSPRENRTPKSSLEGKHYIRLIIGPGSAVYTRFELVVSCVTGKHVGPLHQYTDCRGCFHSSGATPDWFPSTDESTFELPVGLEPTTY
jgi:hypothetical protein